MNLNSIKITQLKTYKFIFPSIQPTTIKLITILSICSSDNHIMETVEKSATYVYCKKTTLMTCCRYNFVSRLRKFKEYLLAFSGIVGIVINIFINAPDENVAA